MNYPHTYNNPKANTPMNPQAAQPEDRFTNMEKRIEKIFFRVGTIEKDLAQLLHMNGLQSSNKYLNNN